MILEVHEKKTKATMETLVITQAITRVIALKETILIEPTIEVEMERKIDPITVQKVDAVITQTVINQSVITQITMRPTGLVTVAKKAIVTTNLRMLRRVEIEEFWEAETTMEKGEMAKKMRETALKRTIRIEPIIEAEMEIKTDLRMVQKPIIVAEMEIKTDLRMVQKADTIIAQNIMTLIEAEMEIKIDLRMVQKADARIAQNIMTLTGAEIAAEMKRGIDPITVQKVDAVITQNTMRQIGRIMVAIVTNHRMLQKVEIEDY